MASRGWWHPCRLRGGDHRMTSAAPVWFWHSSGATSRTYVSALRASYISPHGLRSGDVLHPSCREHVLRQEPRGATSAQKQPALEVPLQGIAGEVGASDQGRAPVHDQ